MTGFAHNEALPVHSETGENSFTPAGDRQEVFLPDLRARRDANPQGRQAGPVLAVPAFLASVLIHTCVIASGILLCRLAG